MTESYLYLFLKAVFTLALVLGLLGALLWGLKWYMARFGSQGSMGKAGPVVKVLGTAFLGPKKSISIVEVAGETLLLGVTPTSITFLAKVENEQAVEELKKTAASGKKPFMGLFQ